MEQVDIKAINCLMRYMVKTAFRSIGCVSSFVSPGPTECRVSFSSSSCPLLQHDLITILKPDVTNNSTENGLHIVWLMDAGTAFILDATIVEVSQDGHLWVRSSFFGVVNFDSSNQPHY